jgi:coenzyme PQQ biosynthesis protein PqqD
MIGGGSRVRLAAKARLQRDRVSGKQFLLYPERGLELSDSAARIVALIVGAAADRTVGGIVDELAAASGEPRERIEREVIDFVRALDDRGLLVVT